MKQSKVAWWPLVTNEFRKFCLHTTLHGYRFIVLPKRMLLERSFWLVIVLSSLLSAIILLFEAWHNFQTSPTIVVTDATNFPIWNYLFPAVTICSFNKMSKNRTINLARELKKSVNWNGTVEELAWDLRILAQLFYANNETVPLDLYRRLSELFKTANIEETVALEHLAPDCDDLLQRCKWKGEEKRCATIFERITTSEGICCAFNYYALRNHTFAGALPKKAPKSPRRVSACGFQTALEVLVNSDLEDYYSAPLPASTGHRVLIHNAFHFPDWNAQNVLVEHGLLSMIGITPALTYATTNVRNMAISKRNCLFPDEMQLSNFNKYNLNNCLVECRMNLTKKYCNCTPFYSYNPSGNYQYDRFCHLEDIPCLQQYKGLIMSSVPGHKFSSLNTPYIHKWGVGDANKDCNCFRECEHYDYTAEDSSGLFTRKYATNQLNLYGGITIKDQSVIRVFYNDLIARRNRRDVTFSWNTLLAYYGGLLGIFIGFSFIAAVELFYFFTIRLYADYKSDKRTSKRKKQPMKKMQELDASKLGRINIIDGPQFKIGKNRFA